MYLLVKDKKIVDWDFMSDHLWWVRSSSLEQQEELLDHLICPLPLEHGPTKFIKNVEEDKNNNIYFEIHICYYPIYSLLQEIDLGENLLCLKSRLNCNMHVLYLLFVKEIQTTFTDASLKMDNSL